MAGIRACHDLEQAPRLVTDWQPRQVVPAGVGVTSVAYWMNLGEPCTAIHKLDVRGRSPPLTSQLIVRPDALRSVGAVWPSLNVPFGFLSRAEEPNTDLTAGRRRALACRAFRPTAGADAAAWGSSWSCLAKIERVWNRGRQGDWRRRVLPGV